MTKLYDMIEVLDDVKDMTEDNDTKRALFEIQECLEELREYRKKEEIRKQSADPDNKRWRVVGQDGDPVDQQPLYLTVQKQGSETRTLIEGSMEDGKWYNDDGVSLKGKKMNVIAWFPKEAPEEPYQG